MIKIPNIEEIKKAIDKFERVLDSFQDEERKQALKKMVEYFGSRLYECPASTHEDHHDCHPGGLIIHTLMVTKNLFALNKLFTLGKYDADTLFLIGCFHDIGKLGSSKEPYYIENDEDWQKQKYGRHYKINPRLSYMNHAARSALTLATFGVKMTDEEQQAILYHDGMYIPENANLANKETPLTLILHWADLAACEQSRGTFEHIKVE